MSLAKNIPLICVICGRKNRLSLIYSIFNHEHHYTADDGHGEESESHPCGDDAECKGNGSCDGGGCCLGYCWECHYGKGDVWHIIEETAEKRVPYLSADKQWWDDADEIRHHNHYEYVDPEIVHRVIFPTPFLPFGHPFPVKGQGGSYLLSFVRTPL